MREGLQAQLVNYHDYGGYQHDLEAVAAEAKAYLQHAVLGPSLEAAVAAVVWVLYAFFIGRLGGRVKRLRLIVAGLGRGGRLKGEDACQGSGRLSLVSVSSRMAA